MSACGRYAIAYRPYACRHCGHTIAEGDSYWREIDGANILAAHPSCDAEHTNRARSGQ